MARLHDALRLTRVEISPRVDFNPPLGGRVEINPGQENRTNVLLCVSRARFERHCRVQMQISRERIHVTIQDCRSGLLAAYQCLTRVNCLHVNAHLFCLSYRLSTRAELDPG